MLRLRLRATGLGIVLLLIAVFSAIGAFLAVHEFTNLLFDAFRDRSIAYVQAFATSIDPWLDPLDVDMLRAASTLMMAGSSLFVCLEADGEAIVHELPEGLQEGGLERRAEASGLTSSTTAAWSRLPDGSRFLDVTAPLSGVSRGFVRIGIDPAAVALQSRHTAVLAAGAAALFALLVSGAILWSARRPEAGVSDADSVQEPRRLVTGSLAIDLDAKAVTLGGKPVALTPKQFHLLRFLAGRADRVCSDREILDAVWPGSAYADGKDVKQYIYLVRRRLAAVDAREKGRIETVPGFGYRLVSTLVDREMTGE